MKRIFVKAVGLATGERLLLGAFLDLVALNDGQVFGLADTNDAPIVFVSPASHEGAAMLAKPDGGVSYVSYGADSQPHPTVHWTLPLPVRLAPLRELLAGIVETRIEAQPSASSQTENEGVAAIAAVPTHPQSIAAHRKLEHVLRIIDRVMKDRVAHALCGASRAEITIFPDQAKVSIRSETQAWAKELDSATRILSAMPRVGAHLDRSTLVLSMDQFRWQLAKAMSHGILLPGIAEVRKFSLLKWPDFGTLGASNPYELRICAMLTSMSASIEQILKAVPAKRSEVAALLNACALIGCLRDAPKDLLVTNQSVLAPSQLPEGSARPSTPPALAVSTSSPSQRGFAGILGKLRAALSFTPRSN